MTGAQSAPVVLLGGGNMGGAILHGLRARRPRQPVYVVDPKIEAPEGATLVPTIDRLPALERPLVVIAVKPQVVPLLLHDLLPLAQAQALFVSIAAGLTIAWFRQTLGEDAQVVRAMPNTPAAVLKGVSGIYAGPEIGADARVQIGDLFNAVGELVWLKSESQIDLVTSISGSGPAYFFRFAEALAAAGAAAGLDPDVAMKLARGTLEGAGALAATDPRPLADLRRAVTSPGGTTAAALARFDADGRLDALTAEAAAAAAARAAELAGGS